MAYNFYIGKPVCVRDDGWVQGPQVRPRVEPVSTPPGEEPVHTDPHEIPQDAGSGERSPSFRTWSQVLEALPRFAVMWDEICEYAKENNEPPYIPVDVYSPYLHLVEDEALTTLETGDVGERCCAYRALWFVRWSRYAQEVHGEMAVFQSDEPLAGQTTDKAMKKLTGMTRNGRPKEAEEI